MKLGRGYNVFDAEDLVFVMTVHANPLMVTSVLLVQNRVKKIVPFVVSIPYFNAIAAKTSEYQIQYARV